MDWQLLIPGFIAGLLTFLAPCTLPLVPGYIGIISGTLAHDLTDPEKAKRAKAKIFLNGLFFVIGFTIVFIAMGTLFGFLGSGLVQHRILLSRIGGIFVVLFGLFMTGLVKIPALEKTVRFNLPSFFEAGKPKNSLILGFTFALGWTPCIGPILGSILLLASISETVFAGAFLLFVFSIGLAIPFLLLALGIGHLAQYMKTLKRFMRWVSIIGGLFLVFLGILLITNSLGVWVSFFFSIFDFINYEGLLEFL